MSGTSAPTSSAREGAASARRRRSTLLFVRDLLIIVLLALLVSFLLKTFVVRSFYIPSGSMENTLMGGPGAPDNDRVLVEELEPRFAKIHHGDVVVFSDPGGWLTDDASPAPRAANPVAAGIARTLTFLGLSSGDSDEYLVKRVIGLPGDHVVCCGAGGKVSVNGVALTEPYLKPEPAGSEHAGDDFDVTVPPGELWLLGDNRLGSKDSSLNQRLPGHGFVPERDVVGRAVVVSWPIDRWSWLSDFPKVFGDVPASSGATRPTTGPVR